MSPKIKIALVALVFLTIAGAVAGLYLFNLKAKDIEKEKPDYILPATELQKSFEDDEDAAALKYINKIIEVSGEISSLNYGENASQNISLKTGSDFSMVICSYTKSNKIYTLKVGDKITVRGVCSGYLMDVLLNNCVIID